MGISRLRVRDFIGGLVGMLPTITMYVYAGQVAGDLAALFSGEARPRGTAYYAMLILGLATTIIASVLVARTAARSVRREMESYGRWGGGSTCLADSTSRLSRPLTCPS